MTDAPIRIVSFDIPLAIVSLDNGVAFGAASNSIFPQVVGSFDSNTNLTSLGIDLNVTDDIDFDQAVTLPLGSTRLLSVDVIVEPNATGAFELLISDVPGLDVLDLRDPSNMSVFVPASARQSAILTVSAVPEPSSLLYLLLAICGLAGLRRYA